jgi:hypothetical protein
MRRLSLKIAALGLGVLAGCLPARVMKAQAPAQVNTAQQVQRVRSLQNPQSSNQSDPYLYPGEQADTGTQIILGASPQKRWNWFSLNIDSEYFHTSNAYLSTSNIKGTWLLVNSIDAEIDAPPITVPYGQLFTEVGYQYEWFDYGLGGANDSFSQLDFDSSMVYLAAQYALPDNWAVFGNLAYTRLLNDGNGFDEFYRELVPSLSLQKTIVIRQNLQASLEYTADYRVTDEVPFTNQSRGCNDRTDQVVDIGLIWQVTAKVDLRPFYRFQYSYYPDFYAGNSRNDFLHTLGLSADYAFNSWSSIRLFLTYELLDTDSPVVQDYRKFDVGAGATAGFKF